MHSMTNQLEYEYDIAPVGDTLAKALSIIAVDGHELFLNGISQLLKNLPFVSSIDTCLNYEQLSVILQQNVPDVIFLELNLSSRGGFAVCQEIRQKYADLCIIILTQYNSNDYVLRAKHSGANAYFVKHSCSEVILSYLQHLANGNTKGFFVHMPESKRCQIDFAKDDFELKELLTCREREVLRMISFGASHADIENGLGISNSTFKMH